MANDDKTIIMPRPGRPPAPENADDESDKTVIKPRPQPGAYTSSDNDRTVIKPRNTHSHHSPHSRILSNKQETLKKSPLIDAAGKLLSIAPQLRQITGNIDIDQLHIQITQLVNDFEKQVRSSIDDAEIRQNASYVLCSLIDETLLNTPWGENSNWSQKTLLSLFHKESHGGERVYVILKQSLDLPSKFYELIELIYLSLSLGFMGKLRIDPKGQLKIEQIRSQAYDQLNQSRSKYQKTLSSNISPIMRRINKLHSFTPVWILIASLILTAFGTYTFWLLDLNKNSDAVVQTMAEIIPAQQEALLPDSLAQPAGISLKQLLTPEIERNILSVENYASHISIVLHAEELFESGSAKIGVSYYPVLDKIAKALESTSGRCVVSGHTDSTAIRTSQYPSNWHLSLARASAVVKYMATVASLEGRLIPEGRGARDPIVSNDTVTNRAKNRRIVIDIFQPVRN